jgi:transcriptional regulator with XRE-family HTH domain
MNAAKSASGTWVPTITVNHRLNIARESAGISAERMAQMLGCTRRTITRWEKPGTRVPRAVLLGYHVATQVDLSWMELGRDDVVLGNLYTPRDLNPEPADIGSALVTPIDWAPSISRRFAPKPNGGEAA